MTDENLGTCDEKVTKWAEMQDRARTMRAPTRAEMETSPGSTMVTGPLMGSTDGDNKIDGTILFVVFQL